jgi:bifunctional UDP-N-acetylglucosamine pyrophosphorylase / glucosamine-1-phosphate N-acetyltransferase
MISDFVAVVLPAESETRFRSPSANVLSRAGGRTLVEHVVHSCQPLRPRATVVVVTHHAKEFSAAVDPLGARSVVARPKDQSGDVMLLARRVFDARARFAIVLPGDAPLVRSQTIAALARTHRQGGAAMTILSTKVANPAGYSRIVRDENGSVATIVADSDITDDQRSINEINSRIYAFTLDKLWPCLSRLRRENKHRKLRLTDCIAAFRKQGASVLTQLVPDADELLAFNTCAELAKADQIFRRRKCAALMDAGVTIQMPETVLVDADVSVGTDTVLETRVQLLGRTRIGKGCTIGTGSILEDVRLEDGVTVGPYSMACASQLAAGTKLGPFSHLRFGVRMKKGARIGNFVEAKQSTLAENVQAEYLSYLGDARIGRESTIGAGTITCNYDGVRKNRTIIGRRVFVGSDTALVAPVRVGDGAYIGAGSTITDNIPADALALARERQVNEPGGAAARRRASAAGVKRESAHKHSGAKRTRKITHCR